MKEIKIIVEETFINDSENTQAFEFNKIMEKILQNELNKIECDVDSEH